MKKVLKFFFGLIVLIVAVVLIGGFVFLKTFDLNKYKTVVADLVYNQTGRQLSLNGEAGLKISLIPTLVLNDVSLSNASWATPNEMIKAQKIEVSLDILPLLKKQLVINKVELIRPEIYLAVNTNGATNWTFEKPNATTEQTTDSTEKTTASSDVAQTAVALGIVAKHLQIDDAKIVYNDLKNKSTQSVEITTFSMSSDGMDDAIDWVFDLTYNSNKISGKAQTGSINAVLQNQKDFPVSAEVTAFGATIKTSMTLNDLMSALSYAGTIELKNPKGNFGAPAVVLKSDLSGSLQKVSAVLKELNVAGNVITGTVTADISQSKPSVSADLKSSSIDLQTFTESAQTAMYPSLISTAHAAEYVPATALDLSVLNQLNAQAKVAVSKLIVNSDLSVSDVNLTAVLKNGTLTVKPLTLVAGTGKIDLSATVSASTQKMTLNATGTDIVLQDLVKSLAINDSTHFGFSTGGKTNFKIALKGQGATLRKMVESLDGQVLAVVGESTLQTGSLKYLSGNFLTQILNSLNLTTEKNMTLSCGVLRADLSDGKAQFPKGIVFKADKLSLVGDGTLNLVNDKLNFTLKPTANSLTDTNVAQALTSLLKVSGTVQTPKLTLDSASVLKGVVGVATAGTAYLTTQSSDTDSSPCYTALKGTDYQSMFPAPSETASATQDTGTAEVINNTAEALKDSAKSVLKALTTKK